MSNIEVPRALFERIVDELRGDNLFTHYKPNKTGDVPTHHSCQCCGIEWPDGQPEAHRPECLIALTGALLK